MPQFNQISTILPSNNPGWVVPPSVRSALMAAQDIQNKAGDTSAPVYSTGAGMAKLGAGAIGGLMEGMQLRKEEALQAASRQGQAALLAEIMRQRGVMGAGPDQSSPQAARNGNAGAAAPAAAGDHAAYIQKRAAELGIDPAIALKVAQSEGLGAGVGDGGSSYGDFQLHRGGIAPGGNAVAGLGDDFFNQTGKDPSDPANWQAADDFALQHAAKSGWGAFHGAAKAGLGPMDGIGGHAPASATADMPAASAAPAGSSSLPPGITPDMMGGAPAPAGLRDTIAAAMQDPSMGVQPTAPVAPGPQGDYMLSPDQVNRTPPTPVQGGLGNAAAAPSLPADDHVMPNQLPWMQGFAGGGNDPKALPQADPAGDNALPASPPLPPPGAQSQPEAAPPVDGSSTMGGAPPSDALALAGPDPMASAPAQRAISGLQNGPQNMRGNMQAGPGANPSLVEAMMSSGRGVNDPSSPQAFNAAQAAAGGSSPLTAALMGAGSGPVDKSAGNSAPVAQGAPQPNAAASSSSGPFSGIASALLGPDAVPPAPIAGPQSHDISALYARAAADPRTPPQFLAQIASMMMPSYSMEKMPDGSLVRIDQHTGQAVKAYQGAVPMKADESLMSDGRVVGTAPSAPKTLSPGQDLVTFGQGNQPTTVASKPVTPDFSPVPGTPSAMDKTSGNQVAIQGGVNTPTKIGAGNGVELPGVLHQNADGTTSTQIPPINGAAPGQNPLAAAQPLVDQAAKNAANAEGLKTGATEQVKGAQAYVNEAAQAGAQARGHVGELGQLAQLAKTAPAGMGAALHQFLTDHHVQNAGGDETAQFNSLRDYLGTQLRQIGSGALRNQEMAKLSNTLGSLDMSPAARASSIQRMADTFQRAATLGDVASDPNFPDPVAKQARIQSIASTWDNADQAIAKGADPAAVLAKMQAAGIPPIGIGAP